YSGRRAEGLDAPVRRSLRLGLYQLRFLSRIPPSAVVNESVNLAHMARLRSAAAFINAVLRRATREPDYDPASNITDPIERLAVETSHPAWLIERWIEAFGREEAEKFARANNEAPPVGFRVVRRESVDEVLNELRVTGALIESSKIAPDAWRIQGASLLLQKLAREGKVYLQDEASQLVAAVVDARREERVLDVCAAPGSKATHMAARTPDISLLVAGDLYEHRARTVVEAAQRQKIVNLQVIVQDAEALLPFSENSFDRVLVDAPCTGTGTLRRNPEIRWRISNLDIADLAGRQRRILANAAPMVKPGGRLVYSTCSVEPEENEAVVAEFLNRNATFKLTPLNVAAALQTADGIARVWPHREGADGFFIAQFEREG
ncbi:MAG: 16S rRNA (cytosine(967)-C(5))-methyltransferase RsmB, partial [Acidobacteriota bacterium]|nr:16S rRNA (cytosine(967)-C(5))-methyltransferase RsmB [Acidobacteriota bacterium]